MPADQPRHKKKTGRHQMTPKQGMRKRFSKTAVVYCDESCHTGSRYFIVGGIFFGISEQAHVQSDIEKLEKHLHALKGKYRLFDTVKWEKVPSKPGQFLNGYKALLQDFLETKWANFKCMLVDTSIHPLGNRKLWGGDPVVRQNSGQLCNQ